MIITYLQENATLALLLMFQQAHMVKILGTDGVGRGKVMRFHIVNSVTFMKKYVNFIVPEMTT